MTVPDSIQRAVREQRVDYSHYTLARFIQRTIPEASEFCLWLCILVNRELARGNVCLRLDQLAGALVELVDDEFDEGTMLNRINESPVVGSAADKRPLILDRQRLYLHRYYHYEVAIANRMLQLAEISWNIDTNGAKAINVLFPDTGETDYQKLAAIVSSRHSLAIISGGPGTGKTWTVSRLLQLLQRQHKRLDIRFAAPTGKAAARLNNCIQPLRSSTQDHPGFADAVTLHRLLGIHRHSHRPRYHARNPLSCDVLVVDEASMIDQRMMALLCVALPEDCRLILLGDKDQLSSVEAGSVFADLCGGLGRTQFSVAQQDWLQQFWPMSLLTADTAHRLSDHVVVLEKSHRFDQHSAIGRLARLVNRGDVERGMELLDLSEDSSLHWVQASGNELTRLLRERGISLYLPMLQAESIEQAFALFHQFRILSPVWEGPSGVNTINRFLDRLLKQQLGLDAASENYQGRPVMMTRNLYQYDIFNGDIGILWEDDNGELNAWFEMEPGQYRCLAISQLPRHETAYAMTVHKSQGSEFERVLVLLPDAEAPVLTRELLYTAITRTSAALEICADKDIIKHCIQRRTERVSGLLDRLTSP